MSLNSIISEPTALSVNPPEVPEVSESDWQKIAKSAKYKEFFLYLEGRKEYYRRYLPDGRTVEGVSVEERMAWWNTATILIKEIEGIQASLELSKPKK